MRLCGVELYKMSKSFWIGSVVAVSFVLILLVALPFIAFASDGTIDSTYKYAWGNKIGWVNFNPTQGNALVSDSVLTGYVWSQNYGWINLSPSQSGVKNNGSGVLSGSAWGENVGWIGFSGVTISSDGTFSGQASGTVAGIVDFDCTNCKVVTSWRASAGGGGETSAGSGPSGGGGGIERGVPSGEAPAQPTALAFLGQVGEFLKGLLPEFLKPEKPAPSPVAEFIIPKESPLAFKGKWCLFWCEQIRRFVFAPLPKEIQILAQRLPEVGATLGSVGVNRLTQLGKLRTTKLSLPTLTESAKLPTRQVKPGKFALPQGVPVAELPSQLKKNLPPEVVFIRSGAEIIDVPVSLSVTSKGDVQQKFTTVAKREIKLVIKPDGRPEKVRGFIIFKSKKPEASLSPVPISSLAASVFFASPAFAKPYTEPTQIEEDLLLVAFEYSDPDGDGIYTAEISAPQISGEYEIITVVDYADPEAGTKEIRLIAVVDPEGYIYEKENGRETRIPGAIISLFWLNPETLQADGGQAAKQYELWPARQYGQENPQITDSTGNYAFLVPNGLYYLKVDAPGYLSYDGKPFEVREGSGIHVNIELKTKYWWFKIVNWQAVLFALLTLSLLYNFYRDRIRERFSKSKA